MKVYVAKYFESEKGLSVEGFRYRKVVENGKDNYIGQYCSYFLKSGFYDSAVAKSLIATTSKSLLVIISLNAKRPILPNPLIAIFFTSITLSFL